MNSILTTLRGAIAPSPTSARFLLLVITVIALLSFQLVAVAQEPQEDSVGGQAGHECDDNPSLSTCPPPPPTRLSLSILSSGGGDDLRVSYSRSTWSGSSSHVYRFELHRARTSSSSYTYYRATWDGVSPANFYNNTGGYVYKVRAKRCRSYSTSNCGGYSSWSNTRTISAASPAPTRLSLSVAADDLTLTWSRSSGSSGQYYAFELQRATSRTGRFIPDTTVNDTYSSTRFSDVTRDRYYKARGKRCTTSSRSTCGSWSSWSPTVYVGLPPPSRLSLSLSNDDFTLTWSSSYQSGNSTRYYQFELHRATSRSGSYTRHASANDSSSSTAFSNVTRDRYYKARGKRCTTSSRSTCGEWSSWSSTLYVGLPPPTSLRMTLSTDDFTLRWSSSYLSGYSTRHYVFELHRASTSSGTFTENKTANDSYSSTNFSNVTRDRYYKARGKRCTTSSRSTCGEWSSWSSTVYVGLPPPTSLRMTLSTDDFTLTWSSSYLSGNSTSYYQFELHRATSRSGTFTRDDRVNDSASSTAFSNVDRDRYYKARGKRCTTSSRSTCGEWSSWSSTVYVGPAPPTSMTMRPSGNEITLSWSRSSGSNGHYYVFELHRATSSNGSYTRRASVNDTSSTTVFREVGYGYHFKVRGKRCTTSSRSTCGEWVWTSKVYVGPAPPTSLGLSLASDDFTMTWSRSSGSRDHYYVFELHKATSRSGTFTRDDTVNDSSSSTPFSNVTRDRYYKARGKRCTTSSRSNCGEWSSWSSTVYVGPAPPTSLAMTLSDDDFTLTWSRSSGSAAHYYVFELGRSTSSSGSFATHATANDTTSSTLFSNVTRDRYYKARGKRCNSSSRTACGEWSSWTSTTYVGPAPPSGLSLSLSADDFTLTWSRSSGSTAHYYAFELHRATTSGGTNTRHATANDIASTTSFDNVTRDRYYKARGKRCTSSNRTTCGEWSSWSSTVYVGLAPPTNLSLSRSADDFTLTWSRSSGSGGHFYVFDLRNDTSSSGRFTSGVTANDTDSTTSFNDVTRGRYYKAQGKRCKTAARTTCGEPSSWTTTVRVPTLPDPPTLGNITVSDDDLSVAFTPTTWSDGSTTYYEFEVQELSKQSGQYERRSSVNGDVSPAAVSNLPDGSYKVRGRRCTDVGRTDCGQWSGLSGSVQVSRSAPPPTALALALRGDNTVRLTYMQSTWTGHTTHSYQFELHRSETSSGTFKSYKNATDEASPLDFSGTHTGYYYKVRGRRCASPGTNCGSWTPLTTTALNVPPKAAYTAPTLSTPTVSGDEDDMTVAFRQSSVTGLNSHNYQVEFHRADSASATFGWNMTVSVTSSPGTFADIDRSKVYKARAKRCKTVNGIVCGPWTSFTNTWDGPSPPASVPLSFTSPNTLTSTFTRSESASGFYQFQLMRSETQTGGYSDYGKVFKKSTTGSSTTAIVNFLTVHTGYYYKAVGRRCKTASADCGEWSSLSASLSVPARMVLPPAVQAPVLANLDELTVSFTMPTDPGAPSTRHPIIGLLQADSTAGPYVPYAGERTGLNSESKFKDVATNKYYKARAKTCTDDDRKLCGAWSVNDTEKHVPAPRFPALTAPTLAPGSTGSIVATIALPSPSFGYLLTLEWSKNNRDFADEPNPGRLAHGAISHTFTGLKPGRGGHYRARLAACTDIARKNCGTAAVGTNLVLPTLSIASSQSVNVGEPSSLDVTVTVSNFNAASTYKIVATSSNTGVKADVLRFEACDISTPRAATSEKSIGAGTTTAGGSVTFTVHGCAGGSDELTVKLMLGTVEQASLRLTMHTVGIPKNVSANGHSASDNALRLRLRWDDTTTNPTSYKYQYAAYYDSSGVKLPQISWVKKTVAGSVHEVTVQPLTSNQIHGVQVRTVKGGTQSDWSEMVFFMPTTDIPNFSANTKPNFATIPLNGYWTNRQYTYHLCSNRFTNPSNTPASVWITDIRAAIDRVVETVNWPRPDGSNIITSSGTVDSDCTEAEIKLGSSHNAVFLAVDEDQLDHYCGQPSGMDIVVGCAASTGSNGIKSSTHIVFRPADLKSPSWTPGQPVPVNDQCSNLFDVALHEAGHAFGLGHVPIDNSIMSTTHTSNVCSPTDLDIGAIMTIYQSNTWSSRGVR